MWLFGGLSCEVQDSVDGRGLLYLFMNQTPSHMKIEKFEDLRCWQAARQLVKMVFVVSQTGDLSKDFDTRNQIRKAALSSMNNIAEGFGRFGPKDFIKFLNISQSSTLEVMSMLYVVSDLEYLVEDKITEIRLKSAETRNRTLALIKYLKGRGKN